MTEAVCALTQQVPEDLKAKPAAETPSAAQYWEALWGLSKLA